MGPGVEGPSYHELRFPLLEKTVKRTQTLKEKYIIAWKQYGCSPMADGWTDKKGRHLINFLVNSPEGTFFFESIDASSQAQVASLLTDLLLAKIEEIGKEYVVQIVTDNGANFKAVGKILEQRIPTFYWTPCAAHCLDLMLEDIGKLSVFRAKIDNARRVTTYMYKHVRLLNAMREKTDGNNLVRPGPTRIATSFLTLQSLYKHRDALRSLFFSEDWTASKSTNTNAGRLVANTVLFSPFWTGVEYCIKASHPLLIVLRIVDWDEKPAMSELAVAMNEAKRKSKKILKKSQIC
ncbi:uncharacterized protein LOC127264394 [Andrographis paniculata]|uniref:uncharacterized protein LOC127264394 n=1 Tax=Andrographis paniculata TaxID=175694 RepID=UPI0021E7D7F4|nr:uncharacterized protein LOC127264394 [Andrographis paniculata]